MDIKLLATIVLVPILIGLFVVILWKLTAGRDPKGSWKDRNDDPPPSS
jgi:hypothetical protein